MLPSVPIINMEAAHTHRCSISAQHRWRKIQPIMAALHGRGFQRHLCFINFYPKSEIDKIPKIMAGNENKSAYIIQCKYIYISVYLLASYKLVYLQSSPVAGFLIPSITGWKGWDPEKGRRPINLWHLLIPFLDPVLSISFPHTEPAPQICPELGWFMVSLIKLS